MKSIVWAGAAALALGLGGCATITRGTTTQFTVDSSPPGAQVRTSTGFTCEATPCTFKMPRKEAFVVTVSKAGYKPSETPVKSIVAGEGAAGFVGNALVGGVIGAGVDVSSGAMMDLSPNPIHVNLDPAVDAPPPAGAPPAAAPPVVTPTAASRPTGTPAVANVAKNDQSPVSGAVK
jgi:hypothetical protein